MTDSCTLSVSMTAVINSRQNESLQNRFQTVCIRLTPIMAGYFGDAAVFRYILYLLHNQQHHLRFITRLTIILNYNVLMMHYTAFDMCYEQHIEFGNGHYSLVIYKKQVKNSYWLRNMALSIDDHY